MNKRHIYSYQILRPIIILFLKFKFGYTCKLAKNLPDNYIVLSNHVTDYDPLMVAASFRKSMAFVGSEHIARWGILSKIIFCLVDLIIRYKGTVAASTVKEIIKRTRKGSSVCLFAEGVRSWDGLPSPILPSTAKMIKTAGCGLVTYKIEGGYFVSPMWSSSAKTRKGYVHGAPVNVYTKEQIRQMSVEEVYEIIKKDLYEDAYKAQLKNPKKYRGKNLAEGLETFLFVCPECRQRDTITTNGDAVQCKHCGHTFTYDEFGMLNGSRFRTVRDYAGWQKEQIAEDVKAENVYVASSAKLSTVAKQTETFITEGALKMSSQAITCGDVVIPLEEISDLAMHGKHALVFGANKQYYELVPSKQFSAYKFQLYYEEWKRQKEQ